MGQSDSNPVDRVGSGFDARELQMPDTEFIRDIEDSVIQDIILYAVSSIHGIALVTSKRRSSFWRSQDSSSIEVTQDLKNKSLGIVVYVQIAVSESIPEKSEEIQSKIVKIVTRATGLYVSSVRVVFKAVIIDDDIKNGLLPDH